MLRLKASATLSSSPAISNLTLLTQTEPHCGWHTCQRTSLHRLVLRHLSQLHSLFFKLRMVCVNAFLSSFLSVVITLSFMIGHVSSRTSRNQVHKDNGERTRGGQPCHSVHQMPSSLVCMGIYETGSPRAASTVSPRRRLTGWLVD